MTLLTTYKIWVVLMAFDLFQELYHYYEIKLQNQLLELVAFNIHQNSSLPSHLKTSFVLIFGDSVKALINRHIL